MTRPVFLGTQTQPPLAELKPGDRVVLSGAEAHHLHVQRLTSSDTCDLVDGCGQRVTVRLPDPQSRPRTSARPKIEQELEVLAVEQSEFPQPRFVLVQALCKNGRDEQAVEAAVELGVAQIIPWQADRSISQWRGKKLKTGPEKWQTLVAKAAKQARRAHWPEVNELLDSKTLVKLVESAQANGTRILVLEANGEQNLVQWITQELAASAGQKTNLTEIWILVGPEGGISDTEITALVEGGAELVRLGGTILRASNAGPSALAVLTALTGYWQQQARC